jgi:hypothetical protein
MTARRFGPLVHRDGATHFLWRRWPKFDAIDAQVPLSDSELSTGGVAVGSLEVGTLLNHVPAAVLLADAASPRASVASAKHRPEPARQI